jgi:hypothetical protein
MTLVVRAAESLHWYNLDGSPQYTVTAKDGSQRSTTLRDARKMNLVPSVTTIMSCAAKPGLEAWKLNQMLLAALTLPRAPDEPEDAYVKRIVADSKEQAKQAAERGTAVHTALESWYEGVMHAEYVEHQMAVAEEVKNVFGDLNWATEKSFAHKFGFGGKVDLHSKDGQGVVLDFKTKEFSDPAKVDAFDENCMQLSAYRVGLEIPQARCANVFVSVTAPGLVVIKEWTQHELQRGWEMFNALRMYWFAKSELEIKS